MTDQAIVQEPVVPVPEAPKEYRYEYQPTDNGQPLGGKQVIIYDGTPEDLGNKMAVQNSELVKLNRRLKKDLRLSSATVDEIPDNISRFDVSQYQLTPVPLTAEERIQLSQDVLEPEKVSQVGRRFVQAELGDPEIIRAKMSRMEEQITTMLVEKEAQAFLRGCKDYYPCDENLKTIYSWMVKNNLNPVHANFQYAYDQLKEFLIPRPQVAAPAPAVEPIITVEPPPAATAPVRPVSSGLTRSNGSDTGPASKSGYSLAEIDKMSGEDYKRLVLVPEFKKQQQAGRA